MIQDKFLRWALLFFVLVAIFLVGYWTNHLQLQNTQLENKNRALQKELKDQKVEYQALYDQYTQEHNRLSSAATNGASQLSNLQGQLEAAKERLHEARKNLDALLRSLKSTLNGSYQVHIADDQAALKKLNQQLNDLGSDNKAVAERSRAYRQQTEQAIRQQKADNNAQIEQTKAAMQELQGQIHALSQVHGDPQKPARMKDLRDQLAALKTMRAQQDDLNHDLNQKGKANDQAIAQEVQSEQSEMHNERDQLQDQIKQTKADLDHWQQLSKSQGQSKQNENDQITRMQQAVATEDEKVHSLQKMIDALGSSVPATN